MPQLEIGGESQVEFGRIKWFNTEKGFGLIQPDSGEHEVFVDSSAMEVRLRTSLFLSIHITKRIP